MPETNNRRTFAEFIRTISVIIALLLGLGALFSFASWKLDAHNDSASAHPTMTTLLQDQELRLRAIESKLDLLLSRTVSTGDRP